MKRKSLLIALSVLLHLVVIDVIYYLLTSGAAVPSNITAIGAYNLLWLLIAGTVGAHSYNESRDNQ